MKIEIDNYRGFTIYFDTDNERFIVESDSRDTRDDRKSYAACKKWVDDFLKENERFVPFRVVQVERGVVKERVTVTGIRKDGRPSTENDKGEKGQITGYRWGGDYYLDDPANEPVFKRILDFDAATNEIKSKREAERELIVAELKLVKMDDKLSGIR